MGSANSFATSEEKFDLELQSISTSKEIVEDLRVTELKPPLVNQ